MAAKIQDIVKLKQSVSNLIKAKKDRFLSVEFEALIAALASRKVLTEIEQLNYDKTQQELTELRDRNSLLEQRVNSLMQDNWALLRKLRRLNQSKPSDQRAESLDMNHANRNNPQEARKANRLDDESTGSTRMSGFLNDNIKIIDNTEVLLPKRSLAVSVPFKYRLERPKLQHCNTYKYNGRKKILKPCKVEYSVCRFRPGSGDEELRSDQENHNGIRSTSVVVKASESVVKSRGSTRLNTGNIGKGSTQTYISGFRSRYFENGIDSSRGYNNMSDRKA